MTYTVDDFKRETFQMMLRDWGPPSLEQLQALLSEHDWDEFLRRLPPEQVLKRYAPEERLRGLPPEERLRGLSAEELQQLEVYLKTLH